MPTLSTSNFNIVCAILGGFITLFGLVSYLFKEKFYLSEALISLLFGVAMSPHAADFVRPLDYTGSLANLNATTLDFSRLVLGVQLVLAGVQLPSRYLKLEWKSLALLLGPIMTTMWLSSSLLIWGMVPNLSFLHALAVGACITPTDPVLSNSIVKGKFADKNIPKELQKIIVAESGANDGLGYPYLFLALYLIKYIGQGGAGQSGGAGKAIGLWFGETWVYTIILSIVYGATIGWIAKELLHWAEEKKYVDRESFLVFAITLALFIVGTCGMIGSDDVLACFIAGNVFTWDDWFRLETLDDSLQPTIDMLLNLSVFIWFGAICPWASFATNNVIPIYRAIFYLYISLEFLETITVDGVQREDAEHLGEVISVVVWFLTICSIVVHGLSIPLGKLGFFLPRTLSRAFTSQANSQTDLAIGARVYTSNSGVLRERRRGNASADASGSGTAQGSLGSAITTPALSSGTSPRPIYRIGGALFVRGLERV
ncbi:sodium/hydrogen antiporter [Botrytis cinerea]